MEVTRGSRLSIEILVFAVLLGAGLPVVGQQTSSAALSEVHQLYLEDEKGRAPSKVERKVRPQDLNWDDINRRDSIRRAACA